MIARSIEPAGELGEPLDLALEGREPSGHPLGVLLVVPQVRRRDLLSEVGDLARACASRSSTCSMVLHGRLELLDVGVEVGSCHKGQAYGGRGLAPEDLRDVPASVVAFACSDAHDPVGLAQDVGAVALGPHPSVPDDRAASLVAVGDVLTRRVELACGHDRAEVLVEHLIPVCHAPGLPNGVPLDAVVLPERLEVMVDPDVVGHLVGRTGVLRGRALGGVGRRGGAERDGQRGRDDGGGHAEAVHGAPRGRSGLHGPDHGTTPAGSSRQESRPSSLSPPSTGAR